MLSLAEIISDNREIIRQSTVGEQFAMHALTRDADGLLTYSKVHWNSADTVQLTTGEDFAYKGIEEFLHGVNSDGIEINEVGTNSDAAINNDPIIITVTVEGVFSPDPIYVMNGDATTVLELKRGYTYKFDTTDESTESFPLFLTTVPQGGTYTNEYTKGVLNSRSAYGGTDDPNTATAAMLEFTVPWDAPDQLYYASGNNANMHGVINIERGDPNLTARRYEQVRFDHQKLFYYINDRGFLVARYGSDYSYAGGPA